MWVLKSFSKVVVAGPFKSQTEMAKRLGVSHQYVNRKIRKGEFIFQLDGQKVVACREKEFVGGGKSASDKDELAFRLGVSRKVVEKVLANHTSGVLETPQGKVKIQKLKPGEKPALPAVRVLWNDDTEKQDFVSFAAAAKELKIDSKTIPSAIKAGRNFFTRKSDGKQFTFEIPEENTPSRKKPKPPSEEQKQKWAEMKRKCEIIEEYKSHSGWSLHDTPIEEMERLNKLRRANIAEEEKEEVQPQEVQPQEVQPPEGAQHPVSRKKVSFAPPLREEEEDVSSDEEETDSVELRDLKTWEILEKKYFGYWCKEHCGGKWDDTIMVLFHPVSGEYFKVRNYQGIEEFFQERGYSSYLTEKLFEQNKREGEVFFQACRGKKTEGWFRLILCKRTDLPAFEKWKEECQAEREMQQQRMCQQERYDALCREWDREWEALPEEEKKARQQAAAERRELHRQEQLRKKEEEEEKKKKERVLSPPPEDVVEIRNAGQKINFRSSQKLSLATFDSPKSVAGYIRSGLRQKIFWSGPKTRQTVLIDNQEVYLPDLVKEIIVFHIREAFWKEGDYEAMAQWITSVCDALNLGGKNKTAQVLRFMAKTRNLEHLAIVEISKKLASYI